MRRVLFALALLLLPSLVQAASVSYYVVGSITGGNADAGVGTSSRTVNGQTVTFHNGGSYTAQFNPALDNIATTDFGWFTVDGVAGSSGGFGTAGVGFELNVFQTDPLPTDGTHPDGIPYNSGVVVAKLKGSIATDLSDVTTTNLKLTFTGDTEFKIPFDGWYFPPTVAYSFDPVLILNANGSASTLKGQVSIIPDPGGVSGGGDPSAVPLPSVAGLGAMLMGGLLLSRTRRQAKAA